MKRVLATLYILGLTMVMFAFTMLIPLVVAYVGQDAARDAFLHGFLLSIGIGGGLAVLTRRNRSELRARDGFVLVSAVWAGLPLLAAIPLMLYFHRAGMPLSFTGAYFEAMSGLTTTGATVLTNLDALPPSINLWRATLIWIGGMGILVLAVAILPLLGVGGHQVVRAETPGPMKDERLTPRIASTAKALYAVYFVFSILCFLSYRAVGLSWFEAWCHGHHHGPGRLFHLGRRFRPLRFGAGGNRGHGVHADCRHQLRHPLQRLPPAQRAAYLRCPRPFLTWWSCWAWGW